MMRLNYADYLIVKGLTLLLSSTNNTIIKMIFCHAITGVNIRKSLWSLLAITITDIVANTVL